MEATETVQLPTPEQPPPTPPQQPQPQQQHVVQPILRKKPHTDGVVNHVRILPAPTSVDGDEEDEVADEAPEPPWEDRDNPFRPGSDLDREADSLLRNSRISRHSVHLPQTQTPATTPIAASASQQPPSIREDTVGLLTPSTAVTAVIPDDATDSGPDDDAPLHRSPADANGSAQISAAPDSTKVKEMDAEAVVTRVVVPTSSSEPAVAPSKAVAVQLKGGRACCDLM